MLAFAGLVRLAQDQDVGAGAVLRELLRELPRMVLPLTLCPAAPAQGALAVECRREDRETLARLTAIDDAATRTAIAAERALLAARGGGCHQRFGATQVQVEPLGGLLYLRDANEQGPGRPELRWQAPAPPGEVGRIWDGSAQPPPAIEAIPGAATECARRLARVPAAFVAHRRALPDLPADAVNRCPHLWVSGTESWFALAARGVWVEGCAESLGFGALKATLASPLLALPPLGEWLALTHGEAAESWGEVPALATYRHLAAEPGASAPSSPQGASHLWWHSGIQFERWRGQASAQAQHACGPGKTAEHLHRAGVSRLRVFPSVHHWREWLRS